MVMYALLNPSYGGPAFKVAIFAALFLAGAASTLADPLGTERERGR
jgi:hypothetical protein